ncbi:MAG TPA: sigma-70 family RNA polymerase sigma factor [Actinomycetota bacterium]
MRAGSGDALERVYREDGPRLWRALVAYSGDTDVADDAMAEAFAQALARGPNLREPVRWIWRVAFRVAAGELQRRRRRPSGRATEIRGLDDATVELVDALQALSPNQRAAIVLFYYADYPTREIARVLGSTSATVRVHLSAGRKRLRTALGDDDA